MCTDCNEITIPQGPTGATGATGPAGADGAPGFAGINGTDGTTILATYNSLTGVGTPASLVETILFTTNLPANTLGTNGDELEVYTYIEYFNNDAVTLRFKLGSKTVSFNVVDAADDTRIFKIKISRISATSQLWTIEEIIRASGEGAVLGIITTDSSTVDLATILAFEITGQNTIATAGQIMLKKTTLYKYAV